jgi:ketosteroid isomerase-like protein
LKATARLLAIIFSCSVITSLARASDADDVRAAVIDLYAKLNATDTEAFIEYMLPEGYTEFSADGGRLFTIDQDYIRDGFASGIKPDFEIRDLEVRVFKDSAIVTGFRVGGIARPGEKAKTSTLCLSMMWIRKEGKWKLVHVHLSPHRP